MTPEQWVRVEEVFAAALERPAAARPAFLDDACGDVAWLRQEVESLLAEHEAAPAWLDGPPLWLAGDADAEGGAAADEVQVEEVAGYAVLRLLGRGGMGSVYLAERQLGDVRQLVALKIMRRGLDTDDLLARFRTERRILARLEHASIARLVDAGATASGLPYFAMEHVDGVPITDYCDDHRLGVRARLALFQTVCGAVQHAHRSLIVHRDLKPGHVLVTADGVPKLLDFGIGKILDPGAGTDAHGLTRAESRLLTPGYAAPEQVLGEPITTACDVYALGVLLYELLAGCHPYGAGRARGELEALTLEAEPRPPSAAAAATGRRETSRQLRGDLDTIVLKAMRREPEARYASVASLADDIQRHLEGVPVHARAPSLSYNARRFVRRNRVAVGAAATLFLVLSASTAITLRQAQRIEAESARVGRERDKALQVRDFLLEMFGTTGPDQTTGDLVTARQLLDRRAAVLAEEYGDDPELRAEMMYVLAEGYEKLGLFEEAEPLARQALDTRRSLFGTRHEDVVASLTLLGWIQRQRGELDAAEGLLRGAIATGELVFAPDGDGRLARALNDLGVVREARGDYAEAAHLYRRSLDIRRRVQSEEHLGAAITASNLSVVLYRDGDLDGATAMAEDALALLRRSVGPDHQRTTVVQSNLAAFQNARGDHEGAARQHQDILERRRRMLGPRHPQVAHSMTMLANELLAAGAPDRAEPLLLEALEIQQDGRAHLDVSATLRVLGDLRWRTGRLNEALLDYDRSLDIVRRILGDVHGDVAVLYGRRARVQEGLGDVDGAERSWSAAIQVAASAMGETSPRTLDYRISLVELRHRTGRARDAATELDAIAAAAAASTSPAAGRLLDRITELRRTLAQDELPRS